MGMNFHHATKHPISDVIIKWAPDAMFVGGVTALARLHAEAAVSAAPALMGRMMPLGRAVAETSRYDAGAFTLAALLAALGLDLVLRRCAIWR